LSFNITIFSGNFPEIYIIWPPPIPGGSTLISMAGKYEVIFLRAARCFNRSFPGREKGITVFVISQKFARRG
jgi:hypothetical protein